jgi:hypothetical protein
MSGSSLSGIQCSDNLIKEWNAIREDNQVSFVKIRIEKETFVVVAKGLCFLLLFLFDVLHLELHNMIANEPDYTTCFHIMLIFVSYFNYV